MLKANFNHHTKCTLLGFSILCFAAQFFLTVDLIAADSLSYSGRLVQTNGAPVAGPVDLKVELSYTNSPAAILCSQDFTNIVLSNGVFHLKLDLNCGANGALADVLNLVPANESAAIRVTDVTHSKAYSFQAIHSMPFASVSGTAKQLVQMGATNNQVLKWNDTTKKWEPGSIAGAGTVTSVSGTLPISVATGSTSPVVSIAQANSTTDGYLSSADWNTFNSKQGAIAAGTAAQYYRGDKTWQALDTSAVPENVANLYFTNARALGVPLTGFVTGTGAIAATDTALQAFGKVQGQIDSLTTASSNYLIKNSTDSITGVVNVGTVGLLQLAYTPVGLNDATNKAYVDAGDNLKVNKAGDTMSGALTLDSDLKIKGGVNYVTLKGHASSSAYNLILPSNAGTAGYVLQTDGAGNLSWINPSTVTTGTGTVTSASIVDGTIVDVDISATAAIAQSKIANLTTDLGNKVSTTLANGNILVGSAGNVASAVAVSGDATLSNTGALTLANSGVVANTYNSVTVDAKGRVTSGTNPTTLAGYGITDVLVTGVSVTAPITNTGTANVPLIGMPAATTSVDGYLKAADWNTFNNKQAAITAASTLNAGSITTNLQGGVVVGPYGTAAGNTGEIRLKELAANGANYVALRSPDALAADILFTLPTNVGSAGQVLTTDGLNPATLSWTNVATTGTSLVGDIGGTIGANTIGAGKVTLTHLSATGTKDATTYLAGDNTWKSFNTNVIAAPLTGLSSAGITKANGTLTATDSITTAFNKLLFTQGDYVSKSADQTINGTLAINSLTGFITVPNPVNANDAANKGYVDSYGQWTKGTGANVADIYRSSGNVGIGTAVPTTKLQVTGASLAGTDQSGTFRITSGTGVLTDEALTFGVHDGDYSWMQAIKAGSFWRNLSLNPNGGNVGIGTTTPTDALQVSSGRVVVGQSIASSNPGVVVSSATGSSEFIAGQSSANRLSVGWVYNATPANAYGEVSTVGGNPLALQTLGGNVGIGATSPSSNLHVYANVNSESGIRNDNASTAINAYSIYRQNSDTGLFAIFTNSSTRTVDGGAGNTTIRTDAGKLHLSAAGGQKMTIDTNGNVGIGATAPSEKLDVAGVVKASRFESASAAYISISLAQCGGPCGGNHTLNQWNDIASYGYAWNLNTNTEAGTFSHNGVGLITVNKAGSYRIRLSNLSIPVATVNIIMGICPIISGAAWCGVNGTEAYRHAYAAAGYWYQENHEFVMSLSAGQTVGWGYYPFSSLTYWSHDGYTRLEITRLN